MTVERVYNANVTAGVWQTTTLDDDTLVYQTNTDGDFCLVDPFTPCTFADFKTQYPDAVVLGLQVAIGSGIPVTTSYVDGVSLTIDGETDTWDFELAAAAEPTPRPAQETHNLPRTPRARRTDRGLDRRAFIVFSVGLCSPALGRHAPVASDQLMNRSPVCDRLMPGAVQGRSGPSTNWT
jgi:hypothetical protein